MKRVLLSVAMLFFAGSVLAEDTDIRVLGVYFQGTASISEAQTSLATM